MDNKQEEVQRHTACLKKKAYAYLAFSQRTTYEVKEYLETKKDECFATEEDIDTALNELKSEFLIDDKKYVENYFEVKLRRGKKGMAFLKNNLLRKGIPEELIENYVQSNPVDEAELIRPLIQKKKTSLSNLQNKEIKQKLFFYLRQKGFSYEAIQKAIEEERIAE